MQGGLSLDATLAWRNHVIKAKGMAAAPARNELGEGLFPMVPGHEIAGVVRAVGSKVTTYKVSDRVGVGCLVSDIETIKPSQINEAYERGLKSDVRYRFVIDMGAL